MKSNQYFSHAELVYFLWNSHIALTFFVMVDNLIGGY